MTTITELEQHLIGIGHGGTLNKVRSLFPLYERAANTMLGNIDPIETERTLPLDNVVHDDVFNYTLQADVKAIIDLYPQDNRDSLDVGSRLQPSDFAAQKLRENKKLTIESDDGTKFIRINWRSRAPKTVHSMDSLTANGTWSAVGSATNLVADNLFKISGSNSIRFDVVATGDGLQNSDMSSIDLDKFDELADFFIWLYFPSVTLLTSVSAIWGNDLTSNFWTSTAQTTRADGTAFQNGWNLIKFQWSTATETGTVDPAAIDSFRFTIATSGAEAIANVRADNIMVSLGRNFDIKYYSSYAFRSSAGVWIRLPTGGSDTVVFEGTALQIFTMEALKAVAQQVQGEDATSDLAYARLELHGDPRSPDPQHRRGLYAQYRKMFPSNAKKAVQKWIRPRNPNLRRQ